MATEAKKDHCESQLYYRMCMYNLSQNSLPVEGTPLYDCGGSLLRLRDTAAAATAAAVLLLSDRKSKPSLPNLRPVNCMLIALIASSGISTAD